MAVEPVDDRPTGGRSHPDVGEGHGGHRDAGVELGLLGHLEPGRRCGDERQADAIIGARDDRELLDVRRVLNGDLLAVRPPAHDRSDAADGPAATRLEQRDRHASPLAASASKLSGRSSPNGSIA